MACGRIVLILFACLGSICAILDGNPVSWARHSFLVKVFGRDEQSSVKSCTGVLISNSLVLTSQGCVMKDNGLEV
jgi:hypothetical protein